MNWRPKGQGRLPSGIIAQDWHFKFPSKVPNFPHVLSFGLKNKIDLAFKVAMTTLPSGSSAQEFHSKSPSKLRISSHVSASGLNSKIDFASKGANTTLPSGITAQEFQLPISSHVLPSGLKSHQKWPSPSLSSEASLLLMNSECTRTTLPYSDQRQSSL